MQVNDFAVPNLLSVYSSADVGAKGPVPFLGEGNVWIEDTFNESTIGFVRYVIMQSILKTGFGQLSVVGYDENLSGFFAPFVALSEDEPRMIDILEDRASLESHVAFLKHQVQMVQNQLKGCMTLTQKRQEEGRPIGRYELVVLAMRELNPATPLGQDIRRLLQTGPAAGINFIIVSIPPKEKTDELFFPNTRFLRYYEKDTKKYNKYPSTKADVVAKLCAQIQEYRRMPSHREESLTTVEFKELYDVDGLLARSSADTWTKSSAEGLEFTVGSYARERRIVVIGDELNQRHNVLITGAVGQGKSNLISVIIHSLCWNYSPDELELYLLDFKEGVTFQSFANVGREEYLPHARAIGLESDVEFGIAVLRELYEEYQRRMRLFKDNNVRSISEFREKVPGQKLPRIVAIIDEFQLMFGGDQTAREVATLLELSVRLFRAAGIHFILSSQTLEGNIQLDQHRDAIFGQVPIRIALKNSMSESFRTLAPDNPAAAYLQPREAIVNYDYGSAVHNRTAQIAFANEEYLDDVRKVWWERAVSEGVGAPYIYDSARAAHVGSQEISLIKGLPISSVAFGQQVSVSGDSLVLPFPHEPGRNIAIIGSQYRTGDHAFGLIQAAALSLAATASPNNSRFIFVSFNSGAGEQAHEYASQYPEFAQAMRSFGHNIENMERSSFERSLAELLEDDHEVYVFASYMDNWLSDGDGFGDNPFQTFTKRGPAHGKHFIGWWMNPNNYRNHMGIAGDDTFNTKVLLRVSERDVQEFIGIGDTWNPRNNRALLTDKVELSGPVTFVPFVPVTSQDVSGIQKFANL